MLKLDNNYRHSVAFSRTIKFDMYSFIQIVKNYYDLPPNVSDRIEFIMQSIGKDYHSYFGHMQYENVILGITIFTMREFNSYVVSESPPFDVTDFVIALYGKDRLKENITQVYRTLLTIQASFGTIVYPSDDRMLPIL